MSRIIKYLFKGLCYFGIALCACSCIRMTLWEIQNKPNYRRACYAESGDLGGRFELDGNKYGLVKRNPTFLEHIYSQITPFPEFVIRNKLDSTSGAILRYELERYSPETNPFIFVHYDPDTKTEYKINLQLPLHITTDSPAPLEKGRCFPTITLDASNTTFYINGAAVIDNDLSGTGTFVIESFEPEDRIVEIVFEIDINTGEGLKEIRNGFMRLSIDGNTYVISLG